MSAHKSSEQKLVDISFQLVGTALMHYESHFKAMSQEQRMAWVASQLRACGFNTEPCGASWGVLRTPPLCLQDSDIYTPGRTD